MALLDIVKFPDKRLRDVAEPVSDITDEIRKIAHDMLETMYHADGIGLAAIQVAVKHRLVTMDLSPNRDEPLFLINPEIVSKEGEYIMEEGCLSFPGIFGKVKRAAKLRAKYLDLDGKEHIVDCVELFAVCMQHEIDHLNGVTFYDHLSPLKQQMIDKKVAKMHKTQEA